MDAAQVKPTFKPLPFVIEPMNDQIIVELIKDDGSPIIVPENAQLGADARFVVLAVGEGQRTSTGVLIPIPLNVGDQVILNPNFRPVKLAPESDFDDRTLLVVPFNCVCVRTAGRPKSKAPLPKLLHATPAQAKAVRQAADRVLHA